jgi:hypothetical protein
MANRLPRARSHGRREVVEVHRGTASWNCGTSARFNVTTRARML